MWIMHGEPCSFNVHVTLKFKKTPKKKTSILIDYSKAFHSTGGRSLQCRSNVIHAVRCRSTWIAETPNFSFRTLMNFTCKYLAHNFLHTFLRQDPPYLQTRIPPSTLHWWGKITASKRRTLEHSSWNIHHGSPGPKLWPTHSTLSQNLHKKNHVFMQ